MITIRKMCLIKSSIGVLSGVHISSNVYEVIKTTLDLFFFLHEDSTRTKSTKKHKKRKKHKKHQVQTSHF